MKRTLIFLCACLLLTFPEAFAAQDTLFVHEPTIPVRIDRRTNIIFDLKLTPSGPEQSLGAVRVVFPKEDIPYIKFVDLFYTGTTSLLHSRTTSQALQHHVTEFGGGQRIYDHPSYAVPVQRYAGGGDTFMLGDRNPLFPAANYYYVSLQTTEDTPLTHVFRPRVEWTSFGEIAYEREADGHRPAISVRDAWDDGVHSYRIPGLVTTPQGTLLAVYDIRNQTNIDLQEDVQVGLSRSTDGGRTWEQMQVAMDIRNYGHLPASQNGVGDPSILVNDKTGEVWIMALWNHGFGGARGWWASRSHAMTPEQQTGQVLITKSTDDGKSWSEPVNITDQIKDPSWHLLLQGPGRGIVMQDGTLVFPVQWTDTAYMPYASVVWSRDNGRSWTIGAPARSNTTEAQVVEIEPGVLMLNMRDNRGGSRAVLTTKDMGRTWEEHPSSRSALREPVCMASLIRVPAAENALGRDILLFSNPDTEKGRTHITIKASLDGGLTWPVENQVLLDQELGWGYSCLTMVDSETVGILYESSVAQMLFQAVPLRDIVTDF